MERYSDRFIKVKFAMKGKLINVISAYAPQVGCSEEEKKDFRNELEEAIREGPDMEYLVIG